MVVGPPRRERLLVQGQLLNQHEEHQRKRTANGSGPEVAGFRARPPWVASTCLVACALLLGVYADVGQLLDGAAGFVPALGTPWALLAMAGGAAWSRWAVIPALLTGPVLIVIGLTGYWTWMNVAHDTPVYNMTNDGRGAYWIVLGIVVGTASAGAGVLACDPRQRWRAIGWGTCLAVPWGEGAMVLARDVGPNPVALAGGLVLVGLGILAWSSRSARLSWVLGTAAIWAALAIPFGSSLLAMR